MTPQPDSHDPCCKAMKSRNALFGAFAGIDVPDHLRANIERHWENICALVDSLGDAGIEEETIERSVAQVVASYQVELMNSIKRLHKDASSA